MASKNYDPYYDGGVKVSVGGVPCRMASKPGPTYAKLLRSGPQLMPRKETRPVFNSVYAAMLLDKWGVDYKNKSLHDAFFAAFHERYPDWNGGIATPDRAPVEDVPVEDDGCREFGAIESLGPVLLVWNLPALIADRPARTPRIHPANKVPAEPFRAAVRFVPGMFSDRTRLAA